MRSVEYRRKRPDNGCVSAGPVKIGICDSLLGNVDGFRLYIGAEWNAGLSRLRKGETP